MPSVPVAASAAGSVGSANATWTVPPSARTGIAAARTPTS